MEKTKIINLDKKLCKNCRFMEIRENPFPHIKKDMYCRKKKFGVDIEYQEIMSCDKFKQKKRLKNDRSE